MRSLASAPHVEDWGIPYPGSCAKLDPEEVQARIISGKPFATRLRCGNKTIAFDDLAMGPQKFIPASYGNDFALRRSDGVFAYQLATAVDDGLMGINLVVRGHDLVFSTPRQILLMQALALPLPNYAHIPLLLDETGERLAKRHASLSIGELRKNGVSSQRITGYLAGLAGLTNERECAPRDLIKNFSWSSLPKNDLRIYPEALTERPG